MMNLVWLGPIRCKATIGNSAWDQTNFAFLLFPALSALPSKSLPLLPLFSFIIISVVIAISNLERGKVKLPTTKTGCCGLWSIKSQLQLFGSRREKMFFSSHRPVMGLRRVVVEAEISLDESTRMMRFFCGNCTIFIVDPYSATIICIVYFQLCLLRQEHLIFSVTRRSRIHGSDSLPDG